MPKEKRSITITITDLDDESKVLAALGNLFSDIFTYYLEEHNTVTFTNILMSCAIYFGKVLREADINPEDYQEHESF